ncbi:efflux RND transporter permease subunit [Paenibacillus thermotolerans]|uniref:efflux RND transporter permease subunit n=1 Tax=Paenibacillus thermotolerans TaxID=3027807 RepID=UPI002367DF8B|nr:MULTISPECIES: efflux RND transporter permease subunit [unclassified Paenibacillus]
MDNVTKWSFRNRAAIIVFVLMSLIVGVFSYTSLPMELMPEADNPAITVTVIGPGSDAKTMEQKVAAPIEAAVSAVKGKSQVLSTSGNGFARIDMMFESKTNMKDAKAEVQEAVGAVQLPPNVSKPYVLLLNTSMIPVVQMAVSFEGGLTKENMELAEKKLVAALQDIDGAGAVQLYGKTTPQVHIEADQAKLAQYGIPAQALMGALQGRNVSAAVAQGTIDGESGNVNVSAEIGNIDELRAIPVVPGVKLGDVANIEVVTEMESVSRMGGKDILVVSVTKAANANAVAVGNAVEEAVNKFNEQHKDANVTVFLNTSENIVSSVNGMLREVLMGALFATVVILLFLRNVRATLITVVSIPLSLGITLYLLYMSGITLNIITLGGVAVAVGRLVDDSIVVIENIYRRLQKEPFSRDMIISATKEVSGAITSSTLTTVAVFLPMGLLRGGLQAFLLPFALTVTYSLLASLIVALTVVPLMSSWLLKNTTMKEHEGSKRFKAFLNWNLRFKFVPLLIGFVLLVGSVSAYVAMPKGALDTSSTEYVKVQMNYPSDTPVDEVLKNGEAFEAFIMAQKEAGHVLMTNGNSSDGAKWGQVVSPTLVDFTIVMKKDVDADAFMERLKEQKANYPEADIAVSPMSMMGSASTAITVDIKGEDLAALGETADKVMASIRDIEGVQKVSSNQEETTPVYTFEVDPTVANAQEISMQLQGMLNPMPIGTMKYEGSDIPVMLQPLVVPQSEKDLAGLTVMTAGGPVPIADVAELKKTDEASTFYHQEGESYIRIFAQADPKEISTIGLEVNKKVAEITVPDGVEVSVGGASADQMSDFNDLYMTMVVAILLVYLIMVITFKSLRTPVAIMLSLPLAAIGAVVGLIVSGINPDFTAMFGALMLIGVVVTNAIVLIDRAKQNEHIMPIREAVVEAAVTRARPILMTAIATICAMAPLLFHKTEGGINIVSQSLAIVVIGGLAAATVLTLVIVPVFYEMLYFRQSKKQRKAALAGGGAFAAAGGGKTSPNPASPEA